MSIALFAGIIFSVSIIILVTKYNSLFQFNILGQKIESNLKSISEHTPGYPSIKSDGDILNPMHTVLPKNGVVDPTKYLRDFNHGKISTFSNGTTLREFTLIASDDKVREISPNIF